METEDPGKNGGPVGLAVREFGKLGGWLRVRKVSARSWGWGLIFVLAAAVFGFRIVKFALMPDMELGVEQYLQPTLELEKVELAWQLKEGALEVRADSMRPGVDLAPGKKFKASPPRVLFALLKVKAEYHSPSGELFKIQARGAELGNDQMVFPSRTVVTYPDNHQQTFKEFKINLKTGVLQAR